MTIYEILTLNRDLLRQLHALGIQTEDFEYVEMFKEYEDLRSQGLKKSYIITCLAEKYHKSDRTVYRKLRLLERVANLCQSK